MPNSYLPISASWVKVIEREESYTSRASFLHGDVLPIYGKISEEERKSVQFSGTRQKGKYDLRTNGEYVHSDVNGAYNILRKECPDFSQDIPRAMTWYHPRILEYYSGKLMTRQAKKQL